MRNLFILFLSSTSIKEDKMAKEEGNKLLGILTGIGRYIFGLIILLSPVGITLLKGVSLQFVILGMFTPPITLVILPQILVGIYFMMTGKTRIRIDATLILLAIICTIALWNT